MAKHARQAQPRRGHHPRLKVAPLAKVRIGGDGLPGNFIEGNVLRRKARRAGDGHGGAHPIRIGQGPLERLHAAEAAPDHRCPALDAEAIGQGGLGVHPIRDRHRGKVRAVGPPRGRIQTRGPGAAVAAPEIIQGDDKEAIRVDGFARANGRIPPAGLRILEVVVARGVVMAGEGMADQKGVAAVGVQGAVALIDQRIGGQALAASQGKGARKIRAFRRYKADGVLIAGRRFGHQLPLPEWARSLARALGPSQGTAPRAEASTGTQFHLVLYFSLDHTPHLVLYYTHSTPNHARTITQTTLLCDKYWMIKKALP